MKQTHLLTVLLMTGLVAGCSPTYEVTRDNWGTIATFNEAVATRTVYLELDSGVTYEARALRIEGTYDPVALFIVDRAGSPGKSETLQVDLAAIRKVSYRDASKGVSDGFGIGAVVGLSAAAFYNLGAPYSGSGTVYLGKTGDIQPSDNQSANAGQIGAAILTGGLVGALVQRSRGSEVVWEIR